MNKRFTITFPPDRPYEFYSNVFYFGEALHRLKEHPSASALPGNSTMYLMQALLTLDSFI